MTQVFKPARPADVAAALAEKKGAFEVTGRGSKRALGRPPGDGMARLDLSALAGITMYEPEELVLSARAGTPIAEVRERLAQQNQELAFDPPDLSGLLNPGKVFPTLHRCADHGMMHVHKGEMRFPDLPRF